jgi:hypothetical protein
MKASTGRQIPNHLKIQTSVKHASDARGISQIKTHKSFESRSMSSHLIHATSCADIYQLK